MKVNHELFKLLQEVYLEVRKQGFVAENKNHETFLSQHFTDDNYLPDREAIALLYDVMELNAALIFYYFYEKHPDNKFAGGKGEQEFTRACIRKYWKDTDYIIDDLFTEV